jgi:hypothetical protein
MVGLPGEGTDTRKMGGWSEETMKDQQAKPREMLAIKWIRKRSDEMSLSFSFKANQPRSGGFQGKRVVKCAKNERREAGS